MQYDGNLLARGYLPQELEPDREEILNRIIQKNWMLIPCEDNPNIFAGMVVTWFKSHAEEFRRLYLTTVIEYDPIENYNRYENYEKDFTTERTDTGNTTNTGTVKDNGTQTNKVGSTSTQTTDTRDTQKISAQNESGFQNDRQTETDGTVTDIVDGTNTGTTDNTQTLNLTNGIDTKNEGKDKDVFASHIHGNIGVTTTQQMLQSERELVKFNLWDYIADKFTQDLMLRVF